MMHCAFANSGIEYCSEGYDILTMKHTTLSTLHVTRACYIMNFVTSGQIFFTWNQQALQGSEI